MVLQFGMPGGVELLVILLMALIVFGLPLVLIAVFGLLYLRSDDDYDERIRELEAEIARLEAEIGANEDSNPSGETADTQGGSGTDGSAGDSDAATRE